MASNDALVKAILSCYGYDPGSAALEKTTRQLLQDTTVQHYTKRLDSEIVALLTQPTFTVTKPRSAFLLQRDSKRFPFTTNDTMSEIKIKMRVPNLTAGKAFDEPIRAIDERPNRLELCHVNGGEGIDGLTVNIEQFSIHGVIADPGDYLIHLQAVELRPTGGRQRVQVALKITVNPDPKSLWKNIPSDDSLRFHKPDNHTLYIDAPSVVLMGASVRGRSHAHKGIHRDDDFGLACSESSSWSIVCVADGAGSCKYSRRGSQLACSTATRTLMQALNGEDGHSGYGQALEASYFDDQRDGSDSHKRTRQDIYRHTIVKSVYDALRAIQGSVDESQGDRLKDFSTTLLLAAHKKTDTGHLVLSFWVGDGAVVIYHENTSLTLLGRPDSGEFAGQTRFLDRKIFDDHSVYQRISLTHVRDMSALILASDGITDPWFETEKALSQIDLWDALWGQIKPCFIQSDLSVGANDLAQWMNFWSPGNHDDRTLAVCWVKE